VELQATLWRGEVEARRTVSLRALFGTHQ
jgi:hypothetical protein